MDARDLNELIDALDREVPDPHEGLPQEVFRYVSRMTPLVNVDLLVHDAGKRVLLAWRDDEFAGRGWHVPGGIVRYKETFEQRIRKVAEEELGAEVAFDPAPIAINEVFKPHATRGHFVSLLYRCSLPQTYVPPNPGRTPEMSGWLEWHDGPPTNLIATHERLYRRWM